MAKTQISRFIIILTVLLAGAYYARAKIESRMVEFRLYADKTQRISAGRPADILILGESRSVGITGNAKQAKEHGIYNLSMPAIQGVYASKYLLERYLEHNPAPKAVLLTFDPLTYSGWRCLLAGGTQGAEPALNYHIHSAARVFSVLDLLADPLARRHPRAIWRVFKAKLNLNLIYHPLLNKVRDDMYDADTGTALFKKDSDWDWSPARDRKSEREFRVHPEAREHLMSILALARQHGFRVVAYAPPIYDRMYQARQRRGFYDDYLAFVGQLQRTYPDVFVAWDRVEVLGKDSFVDGKHYSVRGSQLVAERSLGPVLDWLDVPDLRLRSAARSPGAALGEVRARAKPAPALTRPVRLDCDLPSEATSRSTRGLGCPAS